MPNRPTHPRIALPPALALRVDALRAGAPTGRPSRQAVVEAALSRGLDALEAAQGARGGADGSKGDGRAADAPTGPAAPALARQVARRHRPVPCPLDPRFLAWQAAAERFVASLDPANHGRSGPLHCAWEGRYLGGYTSLDVCDGAATTGGNIEADWIRPWSAGDESMIRDWLGEAQRRPWDMGPACDGCRGLATAQGAR